MKKIMIYEAENKEIEELEEKYGSTAAEIIEMLFFIIKEENIDLDEYFY